MALVCKHCGHKDHRENNNNNIQYICYEEGCDCSICIDESDVEESSE